MPPRDPWSRELPPPHPRPPPPAASDSPGDFPSAGLSAPPPVGPGAAEEEGPTLTPPGSAGVPGFSVHRREQRRDPTRHARSRVCARHSRLRALSTRTPRRPVAPRTPSTQIYHEQHSSPQGGRGTPREAAESRAGAGLAGGEVKDGPGASRSRRARTCASGAGGAGSRSGHRGQRERLPLATSGS